MATPMPQQAPSNIRKVVISLPAGSVAGDTIKFTMRTSVAPNPPTSQVFSATVPPPPEGGGPLTKITVTIPVPADFPEGMVPALVKLELHKKDGSVTLASHHPPANVPPQALPPQPPPQVPKLTPSKEYNAAFTRPAAGRRLQPRAAARASRSTPSTSPLCPGASASRCSSSASKVARHVYDVPALAARRPRSRAEVR